jgi:hypothetical protein
LPHAALTAGHPSCDRVKQSRKERAVSFTASVTVRSLLHSGNVPANCLVAPCSGQGSTVGSGRGGGREDRACRTRHLFLPCHGRTVRDFSISGNNTPQSARSPRTGGWQPWPPGRNVCFEGQNGSPILGPALPVLTPEAVIGQATPVTRGDLVSKAHSILDRCLPCWLAH